MLMRDVSLEHTLQERCEHLHTRATSDPLTGAANRGELERFHASLLEEYRKHETPFSLAICDLDHFKQINDRYGHQAGDDVLIKTASVLHDHAHEGDLVARYGGEEFVLVFADCGIAAATRRAEAIRDRLGELEHWSLGGGCATASFGVTQAQPGDTVETMFRRADRALYLAKNAGRNTVIQLGGDTADQEPIRRWAFWKRSHRRRAEALVVQDMAAPGPLKLVLEKLRGFLADQQAVLTKTLEDTLELTLACTLRTTGRKADLACSFVITIQFSEDPAPALRAPGTTGKEGDQIRMRVRVSTEKIPAYARREILGRAREMTASLRAYLMARNISSQRPEAFSEQGKRLMLPAQPLR